MIPYGRHNVSALDVLRVSKQLCFSSLTQGPKIAELEHEVANYVGAKYAVVVSSGTAALHLSHLALELPLGSQVLTSPISFVASSNAALYCGLKPKFIDINPLTAAMSVDNLLSELSNNNNISAIVQVHFAGYADDLSNISQVCKKKNIKIIEDAAHALGANYPSGEKVGSCSYSDVTIFSLHPVKTITAGEGGIITTNDYSLYQKLISLRSHGIQQSAKEINNKILGQSNNFKNQWYHEMTSLGYHYRLTELQAVLAKSQMRRIDRLVSKRRKIIEIYRQAFDSNALIRLLPVLPISDSACHLAVLQIDFANLRINKNTLIEFLKDLKIGSQVHYKPIPLNPYYSQLGYDCRQIPHTMEFYQKALSIPVFPNLSLRQAKKIAHNLNTICYANS